MGRLRLDQGDDLAGIAEASGVAEPVDRVAVARLAGHGLLAAEGTRLRVTPAGMLLLDAILGEVVA